MANENASANLLDDREVNDRLCSYENAETTKDLYEFGNMMVSGLVDVNHHLDSKGSTLAGYSTAIVALLVSTSPFWRPVFDQWEFVTVLAAAFCAMLASGCSLKAASLYTFSWFSDDEWLHTKYLEDPETLRRYRVLTMHNVVASHRTIADRKSNWLQAAQWGLAISGLLLFVVLIGASVKGWSIHSS